MVEMSLIASVLQGVVGFTDKCGDNLQMSNSLASGDLKWKMHYSVCEGWGTIFIKVCSD